MVSSETLQKSCERYVGFCRRFLLYPMPYARENHGAAKIAAGYRGIRIKIDSGNERADGITFAGNKIRWLRHGFSSELRQFFKINGLRPIAIERTAKPSRPKCLDINLKILLAHPI